MRFYYKLRLFLPAFYIFASIASVYNALLYPQFTVMQLIGSISVPVTDLPSNRKLFFDWGLQMNYDMPYNITAFYMAPIWGTPAARSSSMHLGAVHGPDFTAKALYEGLENMLVRYGFDRSCLPQSICELSQHPFDENYTNMATDVVNFLLKPSIHQGFAADEKYEESAYSWAEQQGFVDKSCQDLYPKCTHSLFNIFTVTDFTQV